MATAIRFVLRLLPVLAIVLLSSVASAQGPSADTLFRDGKALYANGSYAAAREKFLASQEIDPAVGTLAALAACFEKEGKIASAIEVIEQGIALTVRKHDGAREKILRAKLVELEPQRSASRDVPAPAVDKPIAPKAQTVSKGTSSGPSLRPLAIGLFIGSGLSLAAGAFFGGQAITSTREAESFCRSSLQCTDPSRARWAHDNAVNSGRLANIFVGSALTLAAGGALVWILGSGHSKATSAARFDVGAPGAGPLGLSLQRSF
jgi:tetratricopeptide (TPR) repeat protein